MRCSSNLVLAVLAVVACATILAAPAHAMSLRSQVETEEEIAAFAAETESRARLDALGTASARVRSIDGVQTCGPAFGNAVCEQNEANKDAQGRTIPVCCSVNGMCGTSRASCKTRCQSQCKVLPAIEIGSDPVRVVPVPESRIRKVLIQPCRECMRLSNA